MSFEILFITERAPDPPAAEIQFNGHRLCLVRFSDARDPLIEFDRSVDVASAVPMSFPIGEFETAVQLAVDHLAEWLRYLAVRKLDA